MTSIVHICLSNKNSLLAEILQYLIKFADVKIFSPQPLGELDGVRGPASGGGKTARDLRNLLCSPIDNDDSRDLDQLTVAEASEYTVRIIVAISDVDAIVRIGSAINAHTYHNTPTILFCLEICDQVINILVGHQPSRHHYGKLVPGRVNSSKYAAYEKNPH